MMYIYIYIYIYGNHKSFKPIHFSSYGNIYIYIYIYIYTYCDLFHLFLISFYEFLFGKGFREKCKHTELALNFIQKQ